MRYMACLAVYTATVTSSSQSIKTVLAKGLRKYTQTKPGFQDVCSSCSSVSSSCASVSAPSSSSILYVISEQLPLCIFLVLPQALGSKSSAVQRNEKMLTENRFFLYLVIPVEWKMTSIAIGRCKSTPSGKCYTHEHTCSTITVPCPYSLRWCHCASNPRP